MSAPPKSRSTKQTIAAPARGAWLILAAAALWGTTGTAQALAPPAAQPATIGALRLLIGGGALLALAVARGALKRGRRWPALPTGVAALSVAAYQLFFFSGVARTGVALGTVVGIGSSPIWGGLLGKLIRGESLSKRWVLATVLAVAGASLLLAGGKALQVDVPGITMALTAGLSYALYTLAVKHLLDMQPPDAVIAVVFGLAAVLSLPILLSADLTWVAQGRGLAVVLHLGLIATAASYVLFIRGLQVLPASTAVTLSMAEPLTAGVLGFTLLGERLLPLAMAGAASLLAGLLILSTGRGRGWDSRQ